RGRCPLRRGCRGRSPPAEAHTAEVPPTAQVSPPARGAAAPASPPLTNARLDATITATRTPTLSNQGDRDAAQHRQDLDDSCRQFAAPAHAGGAPRGALQGHGRLRSRTRAGGGGGDPRGDRQATRSRP